MTDQKEHLFREEAMATHFEIRLVLEDSAMACSLASQCFRELEYLESQLSRYREGSDVHRINRMQSGDRLLISQPCYDCLRQALEIQVITDGLFDVGAGVFMDLLRDWEGNVRRSDPDAWEQARASRAGGKLTLANDHAAVYCEQAGISIDLGGIGKGFALEHMKAFLRSMGVEHFLLNAGGSTWVASGQPHDSPPWSVRIAGEQEAFTIPLLNQSISASGNAVKGSHVIRKGSVMPSYPYRRVWVETPHAALADGLSTAVLLMDCERIATLRELFNGSVRIWLETTDNKLISSDQMENG